MRLVRSRPLLVLVVLGAALAAVGGLVFANAGTTTIGWFAYAPLSDSTFPDGMIMFGAQHRVAAVLLALGAVLLSAAVGFAFGRRRDTPLSPRDDSPSD